MVVGVSFEASISPPLSPQFPLMGRLHENAAPCTASQKPGRNFYVKAWFKVIAVSGAVNDPSRSCSGDYPVATVVIPGGGEGDRTVESPEVKVSAREASNSAGRSKGEPISPEIFRRGECRTVGSPR
jgi:hypothetical protein